MRREDSEVDPVVQWGGPGIRSCGMAGDRRNKKAENWEREITQQLSLSLLQILYEKQEIGQYLEKDSETKIILQYRRLDYVHILGRKEENRKGLEILGKGDGSWSEVLSKMGEERKEEPFTRAYIPSHLMIATDSHLAPLLPLLSF